MSFQRMQDNKELLVEAKAFAENLIRNDFPDSLEYHDIEHTWDVVKAAVEIGEHSGLGKEELEMLELAAWFHDLGYRNSLDDHETHSAEIAQNFLHDRGYPDDKIMQVMGCIMATRMPQSPTNLMEEVLCDADLLHLARPEYFKKARQLRSEIEKLYGKQYTEKQWMDSNKDFFKEHQFFTDYVKNTYGSIKQENYKQVKKKLKDEKKDKKSIENLEKERDKLTEKLKKAKEQKPDRGIETMFRLTSKNHLDLSAMADNKANIMISINSIILSILVSVLYRKLEEYPHLVIPAAILTVVCLITIVFAILATRPNISSGKFNREDITNRKTNLLFFGNFHDMSLEDYDWGMRQMMKDSGYLYGSLIKDIYYLGTVLGKKYKLLRIAYTVFMFGFVIAILSFLIAEAFFKQPYPYY